MLRHCLLIGFLVIAAKVFSAEDGSPSRIALLKKQLSKERSLDKKVRTLFDLADNYISSSDYDSAQIMLNRIMDIYIVDEPTIFNYYLFSRRAEVDYYNGLHQLGITNARRGLKIATQLNDRILLQDAYNMLGLLYASANNLPEARKHFSKSLGFISFPPYPQKYLSQSMPHHIYGNISEVYEKMNLLDSAFYFSKASLSEALKIRNIRGQSIANNNLGRIFYLEHQADSSLGYYARSEKIAVLGAQYDVLLLNKLGIAQVYKSLGNYRQAHLYLDLGFSLLEDFPDINTFVKREFLRGAKKICQESSSVGSKLQWITDELLELEEDANARHFDQIQHILNNSISTEARYINAKLEQEKNAKQLQINKLYFIILVLILFGILMAFYQYSVREKLKLSVLKNKISQDLHDDVGASLSSINMSASLAEKLIDVDSGKAKVVLRKISANAADGISILSDIVWAMKPKTDSGTSFESKVKNYGYDLLSVKDIECIYEIDSPVEEKLSNIELRKNLLLIVKEAFNNIARHSDAKQVVVNVSIPSRDTVRLLICDNGKGFDPGSQKPGNGLSNMEKRASDVKGALTIRSDKNKGTAIEIVFRL